MISFNAKAAAIKNKYPVVKHLLPNCKMYYCSCYFPARVAEW